MDSLTLHIPRYFSNKDELFFYINDNDLTIKQLNERFCNVTIIGNKEKLEELINFVSKYSVNKIYPIINSLAKNGTYHLINRNADLISNSTGYFNAKEIGMIYNIIGNPPKRSNIAIIELGGGYKASDLKKYWEKLGLPIIPNVVSLSVDGAYNNPGNDLDSDLEVALNIEIVGGICPNSNIYVYFAPNSFTGFYNALHNAIFNVSYPVNVISISWGAPEILWPTSSINAFNDLLSQAAQRNITICVASGNSGSSDGLPGINVDFPASSPWVLSCGGTTLICPTKKYNDETTKETTWGVSSNGSAGGGGFSVIFDALSYQTPAINEYETINGSSQIISTYKRGVPDVCGNADPTTGWVIFVNNQDYVIGGTSAVAPMWAAFLASITYAKFMNPQLYYLYAANKTIVHDIIKGTNGEYNAKQYWDPTSGVGSPNGSVLATALATGVNVYADYQDNQISSNYQPICCSG